MSTDYLAIEPFLKDALSARVLHSAFDLGIIDALEQADSLAVAELPGGDSLDPAGARFLTHVLAAAGVLTVDDLQIAVTPEFRFALQFKDLMLTRLQFAALVAPDFFDQLPRLLSSTADFMSHSQLFQLFDYSGCREVTPHSCLHASRWMKLTTMLTRYEAPVCCDQFSFQPHRRMLDLGGNSGEFARHVCHRVPELSATIVDLPAVCHVGARHVSNFPESARIDFLPLSFLDSPLPSGFDLITCKSVLHDWPDDRARQIIEKSFSALKPGGRVLLFERAAWNPISHPLSYGLLPILLFFRSYREPQFYVERLTAAGFRNIAVQRLELEVPFMLISGQKM